MAMWERPNPQTQFLWSPRSQVPQIQSCSLTSTSHLSKPSGPSFIHCFIKAKKCGGWGEREQARPADWKIFFSCQQLLWEGSLCYIHTVKMRRLWKQCIKSQQESHTRVFPHNLSTRKKKTHQLKQLMQMLFLLDIIIKFTVLMTVNYIQLVAKFFFICFHFLFSFSWKFHFSFINICDLQSKYLCFQARKYKKENLYYKTFTFTITVEPKYIYLISFLSL